MRLCLLLVILAALMVVASPPGAIRDTAVAAGELQGDVNCGGTINAVDALQVLRHAAGLSTNAPCMAVAGNNNCDAGIDSVDALRILRHSAGLATSVPQGCVPMGEAIGEPEPPSPTSEELIAAALASGAITHEQSLLYRALALYDLPGLPEEFRSSVIDYHAARLLFVEIEENKALLSQETLDALAPIVARPNDPISIFNNPPVTAAVGAQAALAAPVWDSDTAASGKVRVWIRKDWNTDADLAKFALAVTEVWPKLEQVFDLPLPDQVNNPPKPMNPDTAIDIYFMTATGVDPRLTSCISNPTSADCQLGGDAGSTGPWGPQSGNSASGYSMILRDFSGDQLRRVIAHELAHVVQNKYDWHEDDWLGDSTADWVAFRVLQLLVATDKAKLYERAKKTVFDNPDMPLSRDVPGTQSRYGAWLYFFFASQNSGDAIVKTVWEKAAASSGPGIEAADQAIPFLTNFDQFALRNWNQKPPLTGKQYKDNDTNFPAYVPKTKPWYFVFDDERKETNSLSELSTTYYQYTFGPLVHKVKFNKIITGNPNVRVWALIKIGNDWKPPEDWTNKVTQTFCRDKPDENLTELVIIMSNSHVTNPVPAGDKLKMETRTEGCVGWVGTASGTSYYQCCSVTGGVSSGAQILETHSTFTGLWEEDPTFFYGCNCTALFPTGTIDWSVYYHVEYGDGSCTGTDTGQLAAGTGLNHITEQMMIRWDDPNNPSQSIYSGGAGVPENAFIDCDGGFTYNPPVFLYMPANIDLPSPSPTPTPSPSPSPTPTPTPTPTPPPFAPVTGKALAAAIMMCNDMQNTVLDDAQTFSGSCFISDDPYNYEKVEWSFTRVDIVGP